MSRARKTRRTPDTLGSVEKLPSGNYRASYRHEGRKFSAPTTFPTKEAARAWLTTERADRLRGTWRDPHRGRTRLDEYATGWLDSRADLAPRTVELYRRLLARWILTPVGQARVNLAALTLDQVSTPVVRRWYAVVAETAREAQTGRPTGPTRRSGHPARAWARTHGMDVAATGRIPGEVLEAWRAAGAPTTVVAGRGHHPGRTVTVHAYRLLRTICNAAVRDGLIAQNPCTLEGAGTLRTPERPTATPAEVAALAAAMPARYRAAVVVAAWSGLRQGELFALTRRDLDLAAGSLRVVRSRAGLTKTSGSVRTVFLPRFVADVLSRHVDQYALPGPDGLVFPNGAGRAVTRHHVAEMFARARAKVDRPDLTWHDLRHTGATLAYATGASVRDVQQRLGHTTTRAAMIYAHAADDSDRRIADRLDAAYGHAQGQAS